MEILTEIDKKISLRKHIVKGLLDVAKLAGYLKELYKSEKTNSEMNSIWDLRGADFSLLSAEKVRSMMEYVGREWGKSGKNKAALVVSKDFDFGMSRMYQLMMEDVSSSKIAIYKDINEATEWIKET